jgi:uncharacterized protein (UPF0261 family)
MEKAAIAVLGTFDSKGEEHLFLKKGIEQRGHKALTINVGAKGPSLFQADIDLFAEMKKDGDTVHDGRDKAIQWMIDRAEILVKDLYARSEISGLISAGGGSGTHLCTRVMRVLPLGVPKVMVSTVASRNMATIVGTKDITMIHSVVDLLGVNSISGNVLDMAAGAICGMVQRQWKPPEEKQCVALTFFGFITKAAEGIKASLEAMGYEVIPFHANGTGGMAMEELAREGRFHGILDLATHELADALMDGYCGGIGPERFDPVSGKALPRLVVPGGLDCAVLEFTRDNVPVEFKDRKIFYYDFRSAIRLSKEETRILSEQLAEKLNKDVSNITVLVPKKGWSEADREGGPLFDPVVSQVFVQDLKQRLYPQIEVSEPDLHINDPAFAQLASSVMHHMIQRKGSQ